MEHIAGLTNIVRRLVTMVSLFDQY